MIEAPTLTVRALNITVPLDPAFIPREVARGAGDVTWYIDLEGRQFNVPAVLNGRNYRRTLAEIDKHQGALEVVLQGTLRSVRGTRFLELGCAGFHTAPSGQPFAERPKATVLGITASREPGHRGSEGTGSARVRFDWLDADISLEPAAVKGLGDGVDCRLKLDGWPEEIEVQFCEGECQRAAAALAGATCVTGRPMRSLAVRPS